MSIYEYSATNIRGEEISLADFEGKVLVVVNTASKCGFTPQFEGLEGLYNDLEEKGLMILGFPCNQFGSQDPATSNEIGSFVKHAYPWVTFPITEKVDVNGENEHPLFSFLKGTAKRI